MDSKIWERKEGEKINFVSKAVFTLGARALVPGHGHKMVLGAQVVIMYTFSSAQCILTVQMPSASIFPVR